MGQGRLRGILKIAIVISAFLSVGFAHAQTIEEHVRVAPPPDWVDVQDRPEGEFEAAARLKLAWRLSSFQDRVSKTERERYRRFVVDLLTSGAVEDEGTISLSFDPEYQNIRLHHINVIRDGEISERLDLDKFEIFRSETDRDKLIFNGRLTISHNLTDLQAGDTLDYAYTIAGKNPALGEGYFDTQTQEYSSPQDKIYATLLIEDDLPVHTMTHVGAAEPVRETLPGGVTRVSYVRDNVPAFAADDDVPSWLYAYPLHEVSSYESWSEVGELFAPYYARSRSDEIKAIAETIRAEHDTVEAQAREALDYVQRNIRYLAISMGVGGYQPRPPDLVLERRFGDCKDVTLLLLSLLQELGFTADPMLVDTKERGGVFEALPNYVAFDHVVVLASLGEKIYVMDATRSPQLGDIEHYAQGAYGKGLLLREGASRVVSLPDTMPEWTTDITDHFDLASDPDTVTFTNTLTYFGGEADGTLDWVNEDGLASVEKSLLDYFRDIYPTAEIAEETIFTKDEAKAIASLKTVFTIPDAWTEDKENERRTFWTTPYEVRADMPTFNGADRSLAFALNYPVRTRQRIQLKVDETYSYDNDRFERDEEAFAYAEVNVWDEDAAVYTETYSFSAKQDHIQMAAFKEDMAFIDKARDRMGMTTQKPLNSESTENAFEMAAPFKGLIYVGLIAVLAWIGRLIFRRKPAAES